ncbi:MAG: AarF/UbiB family protein [Chitinophagales bacterium]
MFKIFRIRLYFLSIVRGFDILGILLKYFIVEWMSERRFFMRFIPKQYKRDGLVQSDPERLRTVIEELGPTFVKFGQILADRPDIISDKLRQELKKLQTRVEVFDHDTAIREIEEELGGPISEVFDGWEPRCIGSASIGQVYKTRLKSGEVVVVKIQRPHIEPKIRLDLQILRYLAAELAKEYPGFNAVDMVGVVDEFGDTLLSELNYLNEAAHAARFGQMFRNSTICKIPKVHMNLTTNKLLVMEYVEGIAPDNLYGLLAAGIDPKEIAHNGATVLLDMIFKYGFFHADPHAGNLFILPDKRIAFIDFGMVGVLKPSHMQFLAGFTLGLATKNATLISDALLTLCGKKFFAEKEDLEFSVEAMLLRHGAFKYDNMNFSMILNESVNIILKYELRLPANFYLLLKALATLEKFGHNLDRQIVLADIIKPYAIDLVKQKFSPREIASDIYEVLKDYVHLMRDFPGEVNEILYKLKQGKVIMDINLQQPEVLTGSVKQLGRMIGIAFIICALLVSSIVLMINDKHPGLAGFMFGIAIFFSLWMLMRLFIKVRF